MMVISFNRYTFESWVGTRFMVLILKLYLYTPEKPHLKATYMPINLSYLLKTTFINGF